MHSPRTNHNILLKVAYDGTRFMGWQKTNTGSSVEKELEKVLEKILQHNVHLQAASRTDRGVHAEGQMVNFFTEKELNCHRFLASLNSLLPDDISVLSVREMPIDFHPTLHVKGKEYCYKIVHNSQRLPLLRHTHWHIPAKLDLQAMQEGAIYFIGRHDFKAFCNMRKGLVYEDTHRTLSSVKIFEKNNCLEISIIGDHFLYKMVRNIVGTLSYIGLHKMKPSDIPILFEEKKRTLAGITAPAEGLTLKEVFYT